MSETAQQLLDAILKLSEADRSFIAMRLLESLPPDTGLAMDDEDFIEQLNARRHDDEGSVAWSVLRAELL